MGRRGFYPGTLRLLALALLAMLVVTACESGTDDSEDEAEGDAEDEAAGETDDEAGGEDLPAGDGEPLETLTLYTPSQDREPFNYQAAQLIADDWQELGIDVEIEPVELFALYEQAFLERDYGVTVFQWTPRSDRLDPFPYLSFLLPDSSFAGADWTNEEYISLFEEQQAEFDTESRQEMVFRLQEIVAEDLPIIVTFHRDDVLAYNSENFDGMVSMPGEGLANVWTPLEAEPIGDDQVLTIGDAGEPETINPYTATSATAWAFLRLPYDTLVQITPEVQPEPWAAESYEFVDDTTVEVVVRDDMTFHDGEPLTAEDVAFSYQSFIDHEVGYFAEFLEPVSAVEVTGDHTLRFELEEPFSPFPMVTMSQIPILPQHLWEDFEDPLDLGPDEIPTVASGPFELSEFDAAEYIRLDANEDHFAAPNIEALEYILYADTEGVFTALEAGEIDLHGRTLPPGQVELAQDMEHLTVVQTPGIGYYFVAFNMDEEPFDDIALRTALAHATDREQIVEEVLDGRGDPGSSVIAPANVEWHNPQVQQPEFSLDQARQVLEDAGYGWDDNGRLLTPGD